MSNVEMEIEKIRAARQAKIMGSALEFRKTQQLDYSAEDQGEDEIIVLKETQDGDIEITEDEDEE